MTDSQYRTGSLRSMQAILGALLEEACDSLGTSLAAICLVDGQHLRVKASRGINIVEIPLSDPLCMAELRALDGLVVPDLAESPRFMRSVLHTDLGVRFYAGARLFSTDGLAIGSVMVADRRARGDGLTFIEQRMLRMLGREIVAQFEIDRVRAEHAQAVADQFVLQRLTRCLVQAVALRGMSDQPEKIIRRVFQAAAPLLDDVLCASYDLTAGSRSVSLRDAFQGAGGTAGSMSGFDPDDWSWSLVVDEGNQVIVKDIAASDDPRLAVARAMGLDWYAGFPLRFGDDLTGVLCFASKSPLTLTDTVSDFLATLSVILPLVREQVRRERSLEGTRQLLQESEARFRFLADAVPHILYELGSDGQADFMSHRWTEITGQSVEDALKDQGWRALVHPDDLGSLLRRTKKRWESSEDEFRNYHRVRYADGTYRWLHAVAKLLRSPDTGEPVRWYGGLLEVDEEVKARETIRRLNAALTDKVDERTREFERSEHRYRLIFEQTHVALCERDVSSVKLLVEALHDEGVTDVRSHLAAHPMLVRVAWPIIRVNDAFVAMSGVRSREELIDSGWHVEPDAEAVRDLVAELFAGRQGFSRKVTGRGADGQAIVMIVGGAFMTSETPCDRVVYNVVDITERERAQEALMAAQAELARANRLATAGALSASIAHEVNQPVSALIMDAAACLRWLRRNPPNIDAAVAAAERSIRNGNRAAQIVQRTREHFVKGRQLGVSFDMAELILDTISLLEREVDAHRSTIGTVLQAGVPRIQADRVELQQVMVNLIMNALQAMVSIEGARDLTISLERPAPGSIQVSVLDSGTGFRTEELGRVFEPFSSTKADGMGMGLAICRATVSGWGGSLSVANGLGGGAVVTFVLPINCSEEP